jgi:hypothetical protein
MRVEGVAAVLAGADVVQPHPEEIAESGRLEGRGVRGSSVKNRDAVLLQ